MTGILEIDRVRLSAYTPRRNALQLGTICRQNDWMAHPI
jgi:hypothetical protein